MALAAVPALVAALPVFFLTALVLARPELVSDEWNLDTSTRPQPYLWFFLVHAAITGVLWIPVQVILQAALASLAVGALRRWELSRAFPTLGWGAIGVLLCGAALYPVGLALAGVSVFIASLAVIVYALSPPVAPAAG